MKALQETLKYIIYLGIFALLFTPFIVVNSLYFPFITGKAFFFRIIVEIIFFAYIALAILDKTYRPKKSLILYTSLAFVVSLFFSNYFGANRIASFWSNFERMEGYITIVHLFALFIVASHTLKTKEHWNLFFNGLVVSSIFLVFSSFNQIFEKGWNYRVDTNLGNPIYIGGYMLMLSFISLYLAINAKNSLRYLYLLAFSLQVLIMFQTGTRGSMIGFLFAIALISFLALLNNFFDKEKRDKIKNNKSLKNSKNSTNKNLVLKVAVVSSFLIVTILISGVFYFKESDFVKRNTSLRRLSTISLKEKTVEARILNWQIAIQGFKERPMLGWGQSNYNLVFDKYYLPQLHGNETWFDRTHNVVFDWLIAGGIIGLLLYLSVLDSFLYLLWSKIKSLSYFEKLAWVGFLSSYFIHNLFVFDNLVSYFIFFMALAFVHAQTSSEIKFFQKDLSKIATQTFLILILIATPIVVYATNIPSYLANREIIEANRIIKKIPGTDEYTYFYPNGLFDNLEIFERAISRNTFANSEIRQRMLSSVEEILKIDDDASKEAREKFILATVAQLEQQTLEFPNDSRHHYLLAMLYSRIAEFELAEASFLKMLELSPNKQATQVPLAWLYARNEQSEKAYNLMKKIYELDMTKDDIWFEYAKAASVYDKNIFDEIIEDAFANKKYERVERFLRFVIEINKDNPQAYVSLAAFYYRIENIDESLSALDEAIEKFPDYKSQFENFKKQVSDRSLEI